MLNDGNTLVLSLYVPCSILPSSYCSLLTETLVAYNLGLVVLGWGCAGASFVVGILASTRGPGDVACLCSLVYMNLHEQRQRGTTVYIQQFVYYCSFCYRFAFRL